MTNNFQKGSALISSFIILRVMEQIPHIPSIQLIVSLNAQLTEEHLDHLKELTIR